MFSPVQYKAGTDKTPQETETSSMAFTDTNNVHFPDGRLRTVDPWSDVSPANLDVIGGARSIFGHIRSDGIYYLFGTSSRLYAIKNGTWYNMTPVEAGTTAIANSFDTTAASAVVTVNRVAHELTNGDRIKITGAALTDGIPAAELNAEHIITYIDADSFSITVTTPATAGVTGGGGAGTVMHDPIDAGNIDTELGAGYGMGLYGVGTYGTSKTSATNLLKYPRIWSFDSFGDSMIINAGDYTAGDGQNIYIWDGDIDVAPTVLTNAPTDCNYVFVFNNAVVALCGNRIDVSNVGDATVWTPAVAVSAYSTDIERVRRLTAGVRVGEYAVIYSENEVLLMRWINEPDYYIVEDLMDNDGLIAPNAVCVADGLCYWMGQRGFYSFNRSGVQRLTNIQNEDWIFDNINNGQQWKTFAAIDTKYNQVWFYFPVDTANEPSDYVIFNIGQQHWTLGVQARTGMMRNGFVGSKLYAIFGDSASQPASVYRHFIESNPALNMAPYAETSYGMIGEGDNKLRIRKIMPDTYQSGDILLTLTTKEYPQSTTEHDAAYTLTSSQEYVNTRSSGRVRKIRIEQNSAGAYFTMGNWKEDIKIQGTR